MDKLAAYYAQRAAEYERIYAKPERQAELAVVKARMRKMFTGRKVLELACGTGYWTEVIAPAAAQVTAVDINEEVLQIARTKRYPEQRVSFLQGDCYAPPVTGRTHDALFAGFWWSHVALAKLDAFLETVVLAVSPGGFMAFLDNNYVEGASTPISRRDEGGNSYQQRTLEDGSLFVLKKTAPTESELIQRASRHGWGANVGLFQHYWLLTWWAPK